MKKLILLLPLLVQLSGCATGSMLHKLLTGEQFDDPELEPNAVLVKEEFTVMPPKGGQIPVAVYGFLDKTGQRKASDTVASFSSAVTQGGESYLIKALQDVGYGSWFKVVERVGLENLIKERQMIRQMREMFQGKEAQPLPAMVFAGIIVEGAIVGYDSNILTGGAGVRMFGIGGETQYQSDMVTVSLRTVSVTTGEILTSVTITKTVLSYMDKAGVLRFMSADTKAIEAEIGGSINESINRATNKAIQAAVVETIKEGVKKGLWSFAEIKNKESTDEKSN